MLRKLLVVLFLGGLSIFALPVSAQEPAPPALGGAEAAAIVGQPAVVMNWQSHILQPAETFACLVQRSGTSWETVVRQNHLLNPTQLSAGMAVTVPLATSSPTVRAAHTQDTRLSLAVRTGRALWEIIRYNPDPLYAGGAVLLPGAGTQNCLPYPLVNLTLTPQPLVRGKTALLSLETAEPASCEATYLGQTEPCYTDDGTHLYVLLGISALSDAGDYEVAVRLESNGLETFFRVPLKVEPGRYGYQVINPPPALNKLMDAALMQGELDYLANWRVIRTPERQWQFPLDFPLPQKVSVSADYGDRRSYGGLVNGYHSGVDYRAWTGLSVLAPAAGVVLLSEKLEARGNAILVDHGWGLVTGYWHLSQSNVTVGQHVQRGDVIGKVGSTGLSTGSHLHWEVWVNGVSVDGKQWLVADQWAQEDLTALSVLPVAVPLEMTEPQ